MKGSRAQLHLEQPRRRRAQLRAVGRIRSRRRLLDMCLRCPWHKNWALKRIQVAMRLQDYQMAIHSLREISMECWRR